MIKKKFTISFVIPNYNNGQYIFQCIESLENQSYTPDKIIIVDDCSTDNSLDEITKLQNKYNNIVCLVNDRNKGVSYSRNRGILESNTDYICFIDSDDYIDNENFIEIILQYIKPNRLCFLQYRLCDSNGFYIQAYRFLKPHHTGSISRTKMKTIVCEDTSSTLLPRNYVVFRSHVIMTGMFNEEMNLYEDSDLICRLLKKVKPFVINQYGPVYRIKKEGLSHNIPAEKHQATLENLSNKYYNLHCKLYIFLKNVYKTIRIIKLCRKQ